MSVSSSLFNDTMFAIRSFRLNQAKFSFAFIKKLEVLSKREPAACELQEIYVSAILPLERFLTSNRAFSIPYLPTVSRFAPDPLDQASMKHQEEKIYNLFDFSLFFEPAELSYDKGPASNIVLLEMFYDLVDSQAKSAIRKLEDIKLEQIIFSSPVVTDATVLDTCKPVDNN